MTNRLAAAVLVSTLAVGCAGGGQRREAASVEKAFAERKARAPASARGQPNDEALANDAPLEAVLLTVDANNPELREAELGVGVSVAQARSTTRLPDTELMAQSWGVPLREPLNLGQAEMLMIGVRQRLPGFGVLEAQSRAAVEQARGAVEAAFARRVDVFAQTRKTYAELYRLEREFELHLEHVAITEQLVDLARVRYRNGTAAQQDLLRLSVDLSRLHNDLVVLEEQRATAKALLNALMGRKSSAPIGRLGFTSDLVSSPFTEDSEAALAQRPDVASAELSVRGAEASAAAVSKQARWPTFMVGLDYMYMASAGLHAYGASVGMTLPWLNPRNDDEVERAQAVLRQRRASVDSATNVASYELAQSRARFQAAERSLALLRKQIVPDASRSFDAARSGYSAGQGDALGLLDAARAYLDVRVDEARAVAALRQAHADALRAMGRAWPDERTTETVK